MCIVFTGLFCDLNQSLFHPLQGFIQIGILVAEIVIGGAVQGDTVAEAGAEESILLAALGILGSGKGLAAGEALHPQPR